MGECSERRRASAVRGDGVQDPGEPGYPGVDVALEIDFDQNGSIDHTITVQTDSNGDYSFGNLPAVDYNVVVTQPGGTNQTLDPDATNDNQTSLTLSAGENQYRPRLCLPRRRLNRRRRLLGRKQ